MGTRARDSSRPMAESARLGAALVLLAGALACRPGVPCVESRSGHTVAIAPISADGADTVALRIAAAAARQLAQATCDHALFQLVENDPARGTRANDRSAPVQTLVMGSVLRSDREASVMLRAVNLETSVVRYSATIHIGGADPDSAALAFSRLFLDSLASRIGTPERGMR